MAEVCGLTQRAVRRSLDGQQFEVVVIGGGINGVAIARQCAQACRHTLLLEQHDFAAGTTSRSTRIIHGGLRYLENGDFGFVRESLRERQRLLQERPHLVRPIHFLLAIPQDGTPQSQTPVPPAAAGRSRRSALEIRLGLWLYRRLAGTTSRIGKSSADIARLQHWIDSGQRLAIFDYEDAQCEFPERLVAEWLGEALAAGAVARNHAEVLEVEVTAGRATGVIFRDRLTDAETTVAAQWVINAAGPWADRICERSGVTTRTPMLGGIRGSHIVVSKFPGAPEAALYTEAVDGRPIFIIPWNEQLLIGTTEVPDRGDPARTEPSEGEIQYLTESVNHLFTGARLRWEDVHYAFAGVRPLPFAPNTASGAIPRKHLLHDHSGEGAAGMISVIGGKLTTAASLARECARKIGIRAQEPNRAIVASTPSDGVETTLREWSRMVARMARTSPASARAIAEWHGRRALAIACMAGSNEALRTPLCAHSRHVVAEAVGAVRNECAVTLGDILLRRVPVALSACWSEECSRHAGRRIGAVLGWSERHIGSQVEQFEAERNQFLKRPARREGSLANLAS